MRLSLTMCSAVLIEPKAPLDSKDKPGDTKVLVDTKTNPKLEKTPAPSKGNSLRASSSCFTAGHVCRYKLYCGTVSCIFCVY